MILSSLHNPFEKQALENLALLPTLIKSVQNMEKLLRGLIETMQYPASVELLQDNLRGPLQRNSVIAKKDTNSKFRKSKKDPPTSVEKPDPPFRRFVEYRAKRLDMHSHRLYQDCLDYASQIKPLAYFLFEKRSLSDDVKAAYIRLFKKFQESGRDFTPEDIKLYLINMDIEEKYTRSTLAGYYKKYITICKVVYGYMDSDFPAITFTSRREGNETDRPAIPKELYEEAIGKLEELGECQKALLIRIMWCFASRPNETFTITFEAFDYDAKRGIYTVKYYANKKEQRRTFSIDKELYEKVMEHKQWLIANKKYIKEKRETATGNIV